MAWTKERWESHCQFMLSQIDEEGTSARGRKELISFYKGEQLTMKKAILAQCYGCSGYYDGMIGNEKDCQNINCPIYFHMPYNQSKKTKNENGKVRIMSEEHKLKLQRGRKRV